MKVAIFNTKKYDKKFLEEANKVHNHELLFLEPNLDEYTAALAEGHEAVCVFVNDVLDKKILTILHKQGVRLIALRCAGFNGVDIRKAVELGITVLRVPAYSPHGVAEHAVALMLALNRKIHRSHNRVREGNFSLDGLLGFDMNEKTVGILGTGKIGAIVARIMTGFGSKVLAYDAYENPDCIAMGVEYVSRDEIISRSDIISLHVPLMKETYHIIDKETVGMMKKGVMVINTSRGGLIDTQAVIDGLKDGDIGYLGLDVYEEESNLFFEDLSEYVIQDDVFARLLTFPNVIVTGHQAFFTQTALKNIADTTMQNISNFANQSICKDNQVTVEHLH